MSSSIAGKYGRLRTDQRPLYMQVSEALGKLLRNGHYSAGDRLPSEIELSQQLGISRPTLREGLRLLEEQGAIVRRHGVGTFVAEHHLVIEDGLEVLESIDHLAERIGLTTQMSDFAAGQRLARPQELARLGLDVETRITEIRRVIRAGAEHLVAYLVDIVPEDCLQLGDLGEEFRGSVLDLFLQRGWPPLAYSRTELAPEAAGAELAQRLHVRPDAPLQKLEAQLYATDGRVIDYSISYFVPGFFRFHVIRRIG